MFLEQCNKLRNVLLIRFHLAFQSNSLLIVVSARYALNNFTMKRCNWKCAEQDTYEPIKFFLVFRQTTEWPYLQLT
jgi:hypothetical protein